MEALMPNWCSNSLKISGTPEEISRLINGVKRLDEYSLSLLDAYFPCPAELMALPSRPQSPIAEQMVEKYGFRDWYDWCCERWGTKWPEFDMEIKYEEGASSVWLDFDTAWAPPIAGYAEISKQFPGLAFELSYDEPGIGFCGDAKIKNGEVEDDFRDYDDDEEDEDEDWAEDDNDDVE